MDSEKIIRENRSMQQSDTNLREVLMRECIIKLFDINKNTKKYICNWKGESLTILGEFTYICQRKVILYEMY